MSQFTNMTLLAAGLLIAVQVGCGKKGSADTSGTSCEALGAHFAELAQNEVSKLADDSPLKKAAEAQLALVPKARAALVNECRDEKWSDELRGCFVAAKTPDEFKSKCETLAKRVNPSAEAPAAAAPPATPSDEPAPSNEPAPADDPTPSNQPTPAPTDSTPNPEGAN